MPIFTVIAIKDEKEINDNITESYKDNYAFENNRVWFIRSSDTASEIAKKLGMDNEGKNSGVVVKKDSWYGYADVSLWDWGNKDE